MGAGAGSLGTTPDTLYPSHDAKRPPRAPWGWEGALLNATSVPGALTQAIRNFAKSLESWLTNAMMNIPEEMVRVKVRGGAGVEISALQLVAVTCAL